MLNKHLRFYNWVNTSFEFLGYISTVIIGQYIHISFRLQSSSFCKYNFEFSKFFWYGAQKNAVNN